MSENAAIVQHMIDYIETKERELRASKLTDKQVKSNIVKLILDELEREMQHEDQQD